MDTAVPRILVADDDDDVRDVVAFSMGRAGFTVRESHDGPSALDDIRTWRPDLAILDVTMPGMSGTDVLRAVRCDPEVSLTRAVLLTGHVRGTERTAGLDAGADEYVIKPLTPSDLVAVVRSVLQA